MKPVHGIAPSAFYIHGLFLKENEEFPILCQLAKAFFGHAFYQLKINEKYAQITTEQADTKFRKIRRRD